MNDPRITKRKQVLIMNRVFTWIFQKVGFPITNWWLGMQWLHLQIFINQK